MLQFSKVNSSLNITALKPSAISSVTRFHMFMFLVNSVRLVKYKGNDFEFIVKRNLKEPSSY